MRIKNKKSKRLEEKVERGISLFEIFVLVVSILAFAYFVGEEFGIVSAANAPAPATAEPTPAGQPLDTFEITVQETKVNAFPTGTSPTSTAPVPSPASPDISEAINKLNNLPNTPTEITVKPPAISATQMGISQILSNLAVAFTLYFTTKELFALFGVNPHTANTAAWTAAIAYATASITSTVLAWTGVFGDATAALASPWISLQIIPGIFSISPIGLGAAILAVLIYYLFFNSQVKIDKYTFTCSPWQPQSGGADCDKCNKGDFDCNKYKCESLGASCVYLTNEKYCYWQNRNDLQPPTITASIGILNENQTKYIYQPLISTLPSQKGAQIIDTTSPDGSGCIGPNTILTFGVDLDKLGTCRISTNETNSYDEMTQFPNLDLGYNLYNHTITAIHQFGITLLEGQGIPFREDGKYQVYVRCKSTNGVANDAAFVFQYCVRNTPDVTAPTIEFFDPVNGAPVQAGTTSIAVKAYVDKPSECRWDHTDTDYEAMGNNMSCSQTPGIWQNNILYLCTATLTGLKDQTTNTFFFRCNSHPEYQGDNNPEHQRVINSESQPSGGYTLIGTQPLTINSVSPVSGTVIKDSTQSVNVTFDVVTSGGYQDGLATCRLKQTAPSAGSYVAFYNTNYSYESTQTLYLNGGSYVYTIQCCDAGQNCDTKETSFTVETDFQPPIVVRVYNDGNNLNVVTDENSQCVYSTDDTAQCSGYNFDDGIKMTSSDGIIHTTAWNTDKTFYIKCKDQYGNEPSPACSIIVRPFNTYQSG